MAGARERQNMIKIAITYSIFTVTELKSDAVVAENNLQCILCVSDRDIT